MKGVHNNTERGVEGYRVAKRLVQWVQSDIDMDKRGMERGMRSSRMSADHIDGAEWHREQHRRMQGRTDRHGG